MSHEHQPHHDHDHDDAPVLPARALLDAWQVPAPAPDLTDRVMAHVDAALPLAPVATLPLAPRRRGLGLAVVGVAMLAAAALVLGFAQSWSRPPAAESASVAVAAPPAAEPAPAARTELRAETPVHAPVETPVHAPVEAPVHAPVEAPVHAPEPNAASKPSAVDLDDPFPASPNSVARPPKPSLPAAGAPDLEDPFRKGSPAATDPAESSRGSSPGLLDPFRKDARGKAKPDDAAKTAMLRIGTHQGQRPAEAFIDDVQVGTTPIMNVRVTPGRHTVRWQWEDGSTASVELELEAGEAQAVQGSKPTP